MTGSERNEVNLAQHFTPAPVARFVWAAVRALAGQDLVEGSRIIDPAAGEGALVEVVGRGYHTAGIEIDARLAGRGRQSAKRFFTGDALLGDFCTVEDGAFDCVLANPPFGKLKDIYPASINVVQNIVAKRFKVLQEVSGKRLHSFPLELLFVEKSLQLVRPSGWLGLILPEGIFANIRLQGVRDYLLHRADVRAVVALPGAVFRRKGLNARTALLILRRKNPDLSTQIKARLIASARDQALDDYLQRALDLLQHPRRSAGARVVNVSQSQLVGSRWDPGFWYGVKMIRRLAGRVRLKPFGDYIRHLTYGPIVKGRRPEHVEAGVPVIRQGNIVETGLDEGDLLRVEAQGEHDPQRSRVCYGDLLLPRSGTGALGKNRLAVYLGREPANVGCFVDLIRLQGLNPFYAWIFFKSRPGREQIAAYANGVGTPNINFAEIRALKIAALSTACQEDCEARYRRDIWSLHKRRHESEAIRIEGERRFRVIVEDLERYLEGVEGTLVYGAGPS